MSADVKASFAGNDVTSSRFTSELSSRKSQLPIRNASYFPTSLMSNCAVPRCSEKPQRPLRANRFLTSWSEVLSPPHDCHSAKEARVYRQPPRPLRWASGALSCRAGRKRKAINQKNASVRADAEKRLHEVFEGDNQHSMQLWIEMQKCNCVRKYRAAVSGDTVTESWDAKMQLCPEIEMQLRKEMQPYCLQKYDETAER